jgi:hypothetical protein
LCSFESVDVSIFVFPHTHTHTQLSVIYRKSMTNWVLCGRSSVQQRQRSSYIVCILIEADGKFSDANKYLTLAANLC